MTTRYGQIEIANSELFSVHPNGFSISPYLQEKLIFLGQQEVYQQAGEVVEKLLGLSVSVSQIYRLTTYYGQAIEADLDQIETKEVAKPGVIYAQADGAMVLTEEGYKEHKLARIFPATALRESAVEDRGGHIESSLFVTHLGSAPDFSRKLRIQLDEYKPLEQELVFISDGAIWLRQLMEQHYPQATLILDFYHAMSYIGQAAMAAFGTGGYANKWIDNQRKLLLNSELQKVITHIEDLGIEAGLRISICNYLNSNADRMDYLSYRQRGLLIGSGAIESANRTVVQKRLKRAGQRWSLVGAQQVLNLRVCWMSNRWNLVRNRIEPFVAEMAA